MSNQEEWRDIKGFDGFYQVSNRGRVRSVNRRDCNGRRIAGRIITPIINTSGYMQVRLIIDCKRQHKTVHRLVATAFIDNPEDKSDVNHINGNKTDNRVENLEWTTRSENILHSIHVLGRKKGLPPWTGGSCPYTRKLTDSQVEQIRRDPRPRRVIAKEYGVSRATIYRVLAGDTYRQELR